MATIEDVLFALHGKVKEALPSAIVKVNEPLAEGMNLPAKQYAELAVGEPDEGFPQVMLGSGYIHRRLIQMTLTLQGADDDTRTEALFGMVRAVAGKLAADRRLGGLLTTMEVQTPAYEHFTGQGPDSLPLGEASLGVVVEYDSTSEVE